MENNLKVKEVEVIDAYGRVKWLKVTGEFPLTVYLNKFEIVTLMTLGVDAKHLAIGYLKNQNLLKSVDDIDSIQVDWDVSAVVVTTKSNRETPPKSIEKKTVTTGCGQGTMYGDILAKIDNISLPQQLVHQSQIYKILALLTPYNEVYRESGAVHGCALCHAENDNESILHFVEDVGRHNAADSIAGKIWLDNIDTSEAWFYTTGRLTSEMVIKAAQMGVSVLLSRSGITQMGLEMAEKVGMVLIARAKGKFFIVYYGQSRVILDEVPQRHED